MRVDLYTLVHKAQRYHLFRLSEDMGKADFGNDKASSEIARRTLELLEHLKDHARNEHDYIHPLYQLVGAVGANFDSEHNQMDDEIRKIESVIAEKRWWDIYPAYTKFLGIYLLHLDEEEAAQRDILWKHFDDAKLAETFNRFKAERPPHLAKADLELMLPAMSIPELIRLFSGIKSAAPPAVYRGVCELAAKVLAKDEWHEVSVAVGEF